VYAMEDSEVKWGEEWLNRGCFRERFISVVKWSR
jgi:hypothetical protein